MSIGVALGAFWLSLGFSVLLTALVCLMLRRPVSLDAAGGVFALSFWVSFGGWLLLA